MADYKVRLVAGRYCLAETKNNWIVGCGYNPDRPEGQQWEQENISLRQMVLWVF